VPEPTFESVVQALQEFKQIDTWPFLYGHEQVAVESACVLLQQLQAREARLERLLRRVSDAHWHEHSYGEIRPLVREIDTAIAAQELGNGGGE
jgi:hypothetical protein